MEQNGPDKLVQKLIIEPDSIVHNNWTCITLFWSEQACLS